MEGDGGDDRADETDRRQERSAGERRREVVRLAVPAFLALVAEPLFLLTDSAIVGHLGIAQLAGLGVASAALLTVVGLFIFLAYGTTSVVARQLGAGSRAGAIAAGVDGTWLAAGLGLVLAVATAALAGPISGLFGASPAALDQATTYLRIAALGIPGMLVVLATTGVLRGLQDTRTPLLVSVLGFGANIVLNLLFVYGFGWGIAGSAAGTVLAQTAMAVVLAGVIVGAARHDQASLHPHPGRVLAAARGGVPLLVRTLALRGILLLTTWVAAGMGDVPLAAHQVAATIWSFLVFALDAIAIAAQALTGRALGAGEVREARAATDLMIRWGLGFGVVAGLLLLVLRTVLPQLFTSDVDVQQVVAAALLVVALQQPLAGYVFVVDGVLIGAGDGRWLAGAMAVTLAAYAPMAWAVHSAADSLLASGSTVHGEALAVTWLWVAFTGFMAVRGVLLWARVRTDHWMVTGG